MKSIKLLLALFLGATISFTSCSSDDELTPEEQEAKQTEELLATISANYDEITSKEWSYKEFQPSDDMLAASQTDNGYLALTTIVKAEQSKNFGLVVSFTEEGGEDKVNVALNVPEEELEARLIAFQDAIAGFETGFLYDTQEYYIATIRRVVAAPFAADDKEIEDIVDETTGESILSISASNFSSLSYDDLVLSQRKLIEGNSDKIYLNEDGTLTVEVTSEDYGVSKYIFTEVTE
nr:hypothetical protein [uncultured Carboxylicivirga sp.]